MKIPSVGLDSVTDYGSRGGGDGSNRSGSRSNKTERSVSSQDRLRIAMKNAPHRGITNSNAQLDGSDEAHNDDGYLLTLDDRNGSGYRSEGSIDTGQEKANNKVYTSFIPSESSGDDERSGRSHLSEDSGRNSLNTFSECLMSIGSQEQLNYLKKTQRGSSTGYMPTELYGYGEGSNRSDDRQNNNAYDGSGDDSEGHRRSGNRRAVSRVESLKHLKEQLAKVHNYHETNAGMKVTLMELKDRFATKKKLKPKPGRLQRRSSISSVGSSYTVESLADKASVGSRADVSTYSMDIEELGKLETGIYNQRRPSLTTTTKGDEGQRSQSSLPVSNVVPAETEQQKKTSHKTDQMVGSLVWFSFHTPRTVLEDLISHEIDLWRKENIEGKSHHSGRKKMKMTSKGLLPDLDSEHLDDGSLSSLSDDGGAAENYGTNFSENMIRIQRRNISNPMITLPKAVERECALLFVDMSGFTKLSTMLDVESLSKVINSYFDMIVSEVLQYGGDILKFAGDAFFAEWKVVNDTSPDHGKAKTPLSDLNASLVSMSPNDPDGWDTDQIPPLSMCVLNASKCAISIVEKFSDYNVTASGNTNDAMLNVHCGIGMGHIVGLHVGDYKEDQEEEGVELRREFLILGEPIDQVSCASSGSQQNFFEPCSSQLSYTCFLRLLELPMLPTPARSWYLQKRCNRLRISVTCCLPARRSRFALRTSTRAT